MNLLKWLGIKSDEQKWSKKHKQCVKCGTNEKPHLAKGLCKSCYNVNTEKKHKNYHKNKRGIAEEFLTKEKLLELYVEKEMSLTDIGKLAGTTRQNVHYKLKRFEIPARSKTRARALALDKGKIKHQGFDNEGNSVISSLKRIRYNKNFFKEWSNEMAYVLGLIYTDGNLTIRKEDSGYEYGVLSFGQKEKELVEKVLKLMDCDARIRFSKRRKYKLTTASEMFSFAIGSNELKDDLMGLGIGPAKSLILEFPEMPKQFIRHFIRGCWDGDGSVYFEQDRIRASFVCGSHKFIKKLNENLADIGLTQRTIYEMNNGKVFLIRYTTFKDCFLLYKYFYDGVSENQYLLRKYLRFSTLSNSFDKMDETKIIGIE